MKGAALPGWYGVPLALAVGLARAKQFGDVDAHVWAYRVEVWRRSGIATVRG